MKKTEYIFELAQGNLSHKGYDYIVSLIRYYINKYNWPKIILDDNTNRNKFWSDEELLSFVQQFILFVIEKGKLKNYHKIPINYLEYYFKTILVSYVANKIKEHQNKLGLSYDDTKRISLEILKEQFYNKKSQNNVFWNKENEFSNPIINNETINEILASLPKIPITEKTKHYKPRVKTAINDIFSLVNRAIEQNILFNQVFKLFDQSSFSENLEEENEAEIREDVVSEAINRIMAIIDKTYVPIYLEYFFSKDKISLSTIGDKFNMAKSTVHHKINQFSNILISHFSPQNEREGIFFLEKLHKTLDELQ